MWRRLALIVGLLALATAALPTTPLHAQSGDPYFPRIGHLGFEIGGRTAWGKREYNGYDTRTAAMGALTLAAQVSLLHIFRKSESRLRVTDHFRFDVDLGWQKEKQHDLVDRMTNRSAKSFTFFIGIAH